MKSLFYNILYNEHINFFLRNFIMFINKLFRLNFILHPSGTLKVNLENNKVIYFKTNQTSYVTVKLFWEGYKNFEYSTIFLDLVKNINSFIDVGSNIGYYTIMGAFVNSNLKVISFEPSNGSFNYLSKNIILNNLTNNVILEKIALSDKMGYIEFYEVFNKKYPLIDNLSGEHNIGTKKLKSNVATKVQTITLDKYVSDNNVNNLDLIKLDTEGSEYLIMKKGINSLIKFQPIIICEILINSINRSLIDDFIKNINYNIYYHKNKKLVRVRSVQKTIIKDVNDYFFVHPSKEHLIKKYL